MVDSMQPSAINHARRDSSLPTCNSYTEDSLCVTMTQETAQRLRSSATLHHLDSLPMFIGKLKAGGFGRSVRKMTKLVAPVKTYANVVM